LLLKVWSEEGKQTHKGPEASHQHQTSDGPDNLRPLPNPLPRRERELFGVVCYFRGGRRIVPSYRTARQCNQCIQAGCSRRDTSPLSLLGRGAGGEGPKSQTSMEPLTGLITCALSPEGEGICGTQLVASAACSSSGLSFSTGCSLSFARESRFRLTSLSTRLADTLK